MAKLALHKRLRPDRQHSAQFSFAPFDSDLVCRKGFVPGSPEALRFGLHDVLVNVRWDPAIANYRMVAHCGEQMNISAQPHLLGLYGILRQFVRDQHVVKAEADLDSGQFRGLS